MRRHTLKQLVSVAAIGALVGACGGGSSSTNLAEGGIGGTGITASIASGTITDFGSVWVNGVEFDTEQATIHKEGQEYTGTGMDRQHLQIGMVVKVEGEIDSSGMRGTASTVEYSSLLRGRVDLQPTQSGMIVMGQQVNVDGKTHYAGSCTGISDIDQNDKVEVSGFYIHDDSTGNYIQATYVECLSSIKVYKVSGIVERVAYGEFYMKSLSGELEIQWSGASSLQAGDYVEALVSPEDYDSRDEFIALEVDSRAMGLGVTQATKAEMEGIVVGGCSVLPCTFKLGLQDVRVDENTSFSGGQSYTNIQAGVRLEVGGSVSDGVLIANEVEFED